MFIIYKHENNHQKAINLNMCESLYIIKDGIKRFKIAYKIQSKVEPITLIEKPTEDEIYEVWNSLMDSINDNGTIWKSPDLD